VVEEAPVVSFYQRATAFYIRLALRRFNSLATYRDETLRGYFRTEATFSDYYANLAADLEDAHFEQNRPVEMEVLELILDGPGSARVRSRFVGRNGLPLRPGNVTLLREDHWERLEGQWWIIPGKF